jgi:hypothetical protein
MFRLPLCALLLLFIPASITAVDSNTEQELLTPSERAEIDAVVERFFTTGFPDPKDGKLVVGTVKEKKQNHFMRGINAQKKPFHVLLPDGRLILHLTWVVKVGEGTDYDISDLKAITPEEVAKEAKEKPVHNHYEDYIAEYLEPFVPAERERIKSAMDAFTPLAERCGSGLSQSVPAAVWWRLNQPQKDHFMIVASMASIVSFAEQSDVQKDVAPLVTQASDMMSRYSDKLDEHKQQKNLRLPSVAASLETDLLHYYKNLLIPEHEYFVYLQPSQPIPVSELISRIKSFARQDSPLFSNFMRQMPLNEQYAQIPTAITMKAELADMVQWAKMDNNIAQITDEQIESMSKHFEQMPEESRQHMIGPMIYLRIKKTPLADLFALLPNQKASRWIQDGQVRTVGDNALRAITFQLGFDPRILCGRDVNAPWTDDERKISISALQKWWDENKNKSRFDMVHGVVTQLGTAALATVVSNFKGDDQTKLLSLLAQKWAKEFPDAIKPKELAQIMHPAMQHQELAQVIDRMPVQKANDIVHAAWHRERGNDAPLRAILKTTLVSEKAPEKDKKATDKKQSARDVYQAPIKSMLQIAARHPSPESVQLFLDYLRNADIDVGLMQAILVPTNYNQQDPINIFYGDKQRGGMMEGGEANLAHAALPLILVSAVMRDQRTIPEDMKQSFLRGAIDFDGDGNPVEQKTDEKSLRIADIAGKNFTQLIWQLPFSELVGHKKVQEYREYKFNLSDDQATRDALLQKMRLAIAGALKKSLPAAQLPTVIPGITDIEPAVNADAADPVF